MADHEHDTKHETNEGGGGDWDDERGGKEEKSAMDERRSGSPPVRHAKLDVPATTHTITKFYFCYIGFSSK